MTKFQDILAFVKVAELGGFSSAAKTLGVSPSSITKNVSRLEASLGVQLIHRSTRRMTLTEYGASFFEKCHGILSELAAAEAELRDANANATGTVKVAAPPSFARQTIIPALRDFYKNNPAITIELSLKKPTSNPLDGGFDLVVHSGPLPDSFLISRILVRGRQQTVASPDYLEANGIPAIPADLAKHRCIIGGFGPIWRYQDPLGESLNIRITGPLATDSGDIMREAAVRGLGLTQATWWLFREDIAAGRLIPVLEDFEIEADPISIVFPDTRRTPAKVRAVADFLLELTR